MTDLLHPDIPALIEKWSHVLEVVLPLNKWDTPGELAWLCEAASRSSKILELGSYCGVSTKAMAMANPGDKITCVDLWEEPGTHDKFLELLSPEIEQGLIRIAHGTTQERLEALFGKKFFDMAFLDAGHLYDHVCGDIHGVVVLLTQGAILCGHDYRINDPNDGVTRAVRELLPNHRVVVDSLWFSPR